jgi:hypothetical protein
MKEGHRTAAFATIALVSALPEAASAQSAGSMGALRGWDGREQSASAQPASSANEPPSPPQPQLRPWAGAARSNSAPSSAQSTNAPTPTPTPTAAQATRPQRGRAGSGRANTRDASGATVLASMRVPVTRAAREDDGDEQPIVIEMFAAPGVTPFAAPFGLRPFGPPQRPLRLISTYDGDEAETASRVTVTVAPALAILRDYDGEPPQPPEVRVEVVASAVENTMILLPMRVISRTNP